MKIQIALIVLKNTNITGIHVVFNILLENGTETRPWKPGNIYNLLKGTKMTRTNALGKQWLTLIVNIFCFLRDVTKKTYFAKNGMGHF